MSELFRLDPLALAAITGMAAITYATRLAGLFLAGRFAPAGRVKAALDAIPPAVLTAVIAPTLLATGWMESLAGAFTLIAAFRLPLLGTIGFGVALIVALRQAFG